MDMKVEVDVELDVEVEGEVEVLMEAVLEIKEAGASGRGSVWQAVVHISGRVFTVEA